MISCLLLCAGLSQRFGSPKALAMFNGKRIIEHIQDVLLSTSTDEIVVVLGAHEAAIKPYLLNHRRMRVVYNKDYEKGQTTSVQCALNATSEDSKGFLIWPVDCPFIKASTIDDMIHTPQLPGSILIPTFKNKRGHPPLFDHRLKNNILALSHSEGLNTLIQKNPSIIQEVPLNDPGIVQTFNTLQEFEDIKK